MPRVCLAWVMGSYFSELFLQDKSELHVVMIMLRGVQLTNSSSAEFMAAPIGEGSV